MTPQLNKRIHKAIQRTKSLPRRIKRNVSTRALNDAKLSQNRPSSFRAYDLREKGYRRSRAALKVAGAGASIGAGVAIGDAINRRNKRKDPNNPRYRELNALFDDAIEFGMSRGLRKFKRNLDIGGRGMKAARQRVRDSNLVPLHERFADALRGPSSKQVRARKALNMRNRATNITRGAVIGTSIGGAIGTHEGLRQNRNRKKNER